MSVLNRIDAGGSATVPDKNRYTLLAMNRNLVLVKRTNGLATGDYVLPPCEERYLKAATYGVHSGYDYNTGGSFADGNTMVNRLKSMRTSAKVSDWADGHAMLFNYVARSYAPAWFRYSAPNNPSYYEIANKLEYGTSWSALRFNLYMLPFSHNNITTASLDKAYLRLWNPSNIHTISNHPVDSAILDNYRCFNSIKNNASLLCYYFDSSLRPPAQCISSGNGTIDVPGIANNGAGYNTVPLNTLRCDPFGIKDSTKAIFLASVKNRAYALSTKSQEYYRDVEITGAQLTQLKKAIADSRAMSVWLHLGYNLGEICGDSATGGMVPYSTMHTNVSRVELRLKLMGTYSTFNT